MNAENRQIFLPDVSQVDALTAQLLYRCSHDISEPIKSMKGLASLASYAHNQDDLTSYFNLMTSCVNRMRLLLEEVRTIVDNYHFEPVRRRVSFRKIIRQILKERKKEIALKNIMAIIVIEGNVSFYSDPFRISASIREVITNAIAFSDVNKANKVLKIRVSCFAKAVVVNVSDNGIGIHPRYHTLIFNPFFRGCEESRGPGLGLFVAESMIKKLGGSITVKSTPGVGSDFTIWIPGTQ